MSPRSDLLMFLQEYIQHYRRSPTYREISKHLGCSISTVNAHLMAAMSKGLLTFEPGKPRTIVLAENKHCPTCQC